MKNKGVNMKKINTVEEKTSFTYLIGALFVGFAPYNKPKYAIAVVVEHGGGGSKVAAPIARDIMLRALYEKIPPLEAYPEEQRAKIAKRLKNLKLNPVRKPNSSKGNA